MCGTYRRLKTFPQDLPFPFSPKTPRVVSFVFSLLSLDDACQAKKIFSPFLSPLLFPQLILGDVVAVGGGGEGGESG